MFKDDYRKEMQKLTPDSSFLEELSTQMEQEERKSQRTDAGIKTGKAGWKAAGWGIFAAALICIGVGITWFGVPGTVHTDDNVMTQNAGGVPNQSMDKEGIFAGSSWYGSEENPEKKYQILSEKISGDETLQLTASETEDFEDARALSGEETEALVEMLEKGKLSGNAGDTIELSGEKPVYYLAEFGDGVIVKFSVYGERYFYCSEIEGIFKLKD
ncbi:MAG: hypothetical protein HDR00_07845 [Lachnospiraceae bacterium]|nr:hypothetical protein [Lachnospiraceae bacterium]